MKLPKDDGSMTHMPFLAPALDGSVVLFFCRAEGKAKKEPGRVWKAFYLPPEGEAQRLATGMASDVCECAPTAWQDETGWHVSFIAGGAPADRRFRLYRMDGPALDRLSPPVAIQAARTGFIYRDRLVWGDMESLVHVRDAAGEQVIELPGAFLYRLAYVSDAPDRLLISAQWIMENEVFTLEYDLATGHQHFIECDGKPAYKCTILGDEVVFADRCGSGFEERKLKRAGAKTLIPTTTAVRRKEGDVAAISTAPKRKCGCGKGTPAGAAAGVTRPSCLECVEKHIGAAYVLLAETQDGYANRLRAVGHLHEAEDESQEWPELHEAIRADRKAFQTEGTMPNWNIINTFIAGVGKKVAKFAGPAGFAKPTSIIGLTRLT